MATTRNIVNNLENQTIEGSLTITGTFSTNYISRKKRASISIKKII